MRSFSSISAVLLLLLYSITVTHSVVYHQHEEELAVKDAHVHGHSHHGHEAEHAHHHQHAHSPKHSFWGFLDHIFAAHSSVSFEVQSAYIAANAQEQPERTDYRVSVAGIHDLPCCSRTAEHCPDAKAVVHLNSNYTFLLCHSITLRGPPSIA